MERFVRRGRDGRILGVDEFQVAKALLAGEAEILSQEVDGQHLFDLCCHFGCQSTAAAMLTHGVSGCVFRGSSRPLAAPDVAKKAPPRLPPSVLPSTPAPPAFAVAKWAPPMLPFTPTAPPPRKAPPPACRCLCWTTCASCSWGFSEDGGVWMWDWDASLLAAKEAAESTAALPVDGALLDAFRSQPGSPALATGEGLAYLLDLAILLGGAELARRCARHCKFFPLRRWRARDFVKLTYSPVGPHVSIQELDVLMAALAAGVSIQHLVVRDFGSVSIGEAIALSGDALL
ncbi:unnamed protein product, partial [Symbiodinium natans]